jgi:hypothetical protein
MVALCLGGVAMLSLSLPATALLAAEGSEEQEVPSLYMPFVAGDSDADDVNTAAQEEAASAVTDVVTEAVTEVISEDVTLAAEDAEATVTEAEIAAPAATGQQLYLSFITNSPDPEEFPEDLLLELYGNLVGHNGSSEDDDDLVVVTGVGSGITYYVDCKAGNDNNNGKSNSAAWKSITRANKAELKPGDRLLLKRGCSWVGPLDASWQGTASNPILIGAYGSGELPIIRDAYLTNVRITGKYLIVENLHATMVKDLNPDPHCLNQPRGRKIGFGFGDTAAHNVLRHSKATKLSIGVSTAFKSHHNKILYNTITDNNMVWELTQSSTSGATGILLHGNNNEIARNFFARNRPICTYTGVRGGISIELYGASNSNIHHNIIQGDRVFTELGSSPDYVARNNVFAYNLHISSYSASTYGARFVVTRGYGHKFGPVIGTKVYHNVVYFTGTGSKGVTCDMCGTDILTLKNNILWASQPFAVDNVFTEAANIFWDSDGKPGIRWNGGSMHPTSRIANPQFVNAPGGNFRLKPTSPAINRSTFDNIASSYSRDLDKVKVPVEGVSDIGSFEFKK